MSDLLDQFRRTEAAAKTNPPAKSDPRNEPTRFLFYLARQRDAAHHGARQNPDAPSKITEEDIREAGEAMGLEGLRLQMFVENWGSWV